MSVPSWVAATGRKRRSEADSSSPNGFAETGRLQLRSISFGGEELVYAAEAPTEVPGNVHDKN